MVFISILYLYHLHRRMVGLRKHLLVKMDGKIDGQTRKWKKRKTGKKHRKYMPKPFHSFGIEESLVSLATAA